MGLLDKIRGTIENVFQIGIGGPQVKNNSGVLEARNAADSDFVIVRGLSPVGDNDLTTKKYVDSAERAMVVKRQADCSSAIPVNTGVRGFVVVTTAGSGAAIGDVLFDDGSGSGTMEILSAVEGRTIAVTDALSGGTITFDPDSIYIWDEDGGSWIKIGDIGSVTGAIRTVEFALDNSASQDSTFSIPANANILECRLEITTPYSGGAGIKVGNTTDDDLIMAENDNSPQAAHDYVVRQNTEWGGSASVVRATVTGSPAAGAGNLLVKFTTPNA